MTIYSLILIILSNSVSSRNDLAILFRIVFINYLFNLSIFNSFEELSNSCMPDIKWYSLLYNINPLLGYIFHTVYIITNVIHILITYFPSILTNFYCSIYKNEFLKNVKNHINNKLSKLDISIIMSTINNLLINTKFNFFLFILAIYLNSLLISSLVLMLQVILLLRLFIQSNFISRNVNKEIIDDISLWLCYIQLCLFLLILILSMYHVISLFYMFINNVLNMNKNDNGDEGTNKSNNSPSPNNSPNKGNGKDGPSTSYPENRKRKREDYEYEENLEPKSPSKKTKKNDDESQNDSSNDRDAEYESNSENYNVFQQDNNNDNERANSGDYQEANSENNEGANTEDNQEPKTENNEEGNTEENQGANSDDNESSWGEEYEGIPDTPSTIGVIPQHVFNRINITAEEAERLDEIHQRVQTARDNIINIKNNVAQLPERITNNLNFNYGRLDEISKEVRDEESHLYRWQTAQEEADATNIHLTNVLQCRAEANNAINTLDWELYYIEGHLKSIIDRINNND